MTYRRLMSDFYLDDDMEEEKDDNDVENKS